MKVYLRRVRLNSGGYDSNGCYFGNDFPWLLYEYLPDHDDILGDNIRALDREDAKERVRDILARAGVPRDEVKFYR